MEYTPDEVERLRKIAIRGLGLLGVGSVVYTAWKNDEVRAHVLHMRDSSGAFWINLLNKGQNTLAQFSGRTSVGENGELSVTDIDGEGDLTSQDIDDLDDVFVPPDVAQQ